MSLTKSIHAGHKHRLKVITVAVALYYSYHGYGYVASQLQKVIIYVFEVDLLSIEFILSRTSSNL